MALTNPLPAPTMYTKHILFLKGWGFMVLSSTEKWGTEVGVVKGLPGTVNLSVSLRTQS